MTAQALVMELVPRAEAALGELEAALRGELVLDEARGAQLAARGRDLAAALTPAGQASEAGTDASGAAQRLQASLEDGSFWTQEPQRRCVLSALVPLRMPRRLRMSASLRVPPCLCHSPRRRRRRR